MKIDDSEVKNKERFPFPSEGLSNRFLYEVLPDGSWKGKPCFIVGGGPSLRNFDWDLLKGKRTIGVNRAYEMFDPTVIFSMDTRFLLWIKQEKYGPEATRRFAMSTAYRVWLCTYNCRLPEEILILKVWKTYGQGKRAFPATMREGIGHGHNSGYGALNLAACLGANPIYLLGFDMKYEAEHGQMQSHWHKGHPVAHQPDTVLKFIQYFPYVEREAKKMGLRIINLNPESGLDCFLKKPLEKVLH